MTNKKYSILVYQDVPLLVISKLFYQGSTFERIEYKIKGVPHRHVPKNWFERFKLNFEFTFCTGKYDTDSSKSFRESVIDTLEETMSTIESISNVTKTFESIGEKLE